MRKLRATVFFAWMACLLVGAASLSALFISLRARGSTERPLNLAAEGLLELLPLLFVITGALIITRHPRHVIGWLLVAPSIIMVAATAMNLYLAQFVETAPPPTLPNLLVVWFSGSAWLALIFPLLLIPLLFPTGRPLSPRWRWPIYLAGLMLMIFVVWSVGTPIYQSEYATWTLTNPYAFLREDTSDIFMPIWGALLFVMTAASLISVFVRYRQSSAVEREQMKWLLFAVGMFGLIFGPGALFGGLEGSGNSLLDDLFNLMFSLAVAAIPAAIAIAILRYHLFDIDVIIRLTLLYTVVTGLLGLIYFGAIVLLQEAFRTQTGQVSDAAIVITTLGIATLFNPLRQRIQTIIDRRFFRQKYNAEQAMAEFANIARSGADLDALTGILLDITQKSLQPTQLSLYLKPRKEKPE